jgi:hypothetical protein
MTKYELKECFGDAGIFSAKFEKNINEIDSVRRKYLYGSRQSDIFVGLMISLSIFISLPGIMPFQPILIAASYFSLILGLYLKQSYKYKLYLLRPMNTSSDEREIREYAKTSPSALEWEKSLQGENRPLFGYDLEIMSMMSQSHILNQHK